MNLADENALSAEGRKRKRSNSPGQDYHGPKVADRPRLSTPDPRTPGLPSSALTAGFTTDRSSVTTSLTDASVLTVPDEKDDDDGIVRGVAVPNPFGPPSVKTTKGFDNRSLFTEESDIGRNTAHGLLESAEISYSQAVHSRQSDDDFDLPVTKRRRVDEQAHATLFTAHQTIVETSGQDTVDFIEDAGAAEGSAEQGEKMTTQDGSTKHTIQRVMAEDEEDTDSNYETNSDWDRLEEVQDRLAEYKDFRKSVKSNERWTPAQAKLHKLLALRGSWPMFSRSWAADFSIRNIHPSVYAPEGTSKRVAIHSKRNEFRTTRALETIFDLSPLVSSYRQSSIEYKISGVLKKALKRYITWAAYDAGVSDRAYIPTLDVYDFKPSKGTAAAQRSMSTSTTPVKSEPTSDWDFDGQNGSDPISDAVERRLHRLAARHRAGLVTPETRHLPEYMWTYREPLPVLVGFVILQHMVMVVSLDPSRPDNEVVVFAELDMSLADQWLWNALAIALPVHMARDALWERRERLPVAERMELVDPDL